MKTNIEVISPVKKKLSVEIEASEVTKKLNMAYRDLGKRAKIPGFRPGKIPQKILENYYGTQLLDDLTRDLINESFPKAVEETELMPLSAPVVENETLKAGQDFKYTAVMEVKPEFELKDYSGVEVVKEILAVGDDEVEKQLEEIRKSNGKLNSITDNRRTRENDFVLIDYEGFEQNQPVDGVKASNFMLKLGSNDFHPDFEKALIELEKGAETDVNVDFDENHYHQKLAGKSIGFKVKIIDIKEMELPELNDEFVINLGAEFKTLDELREKVKEDLVAREEKRIDTDLKNRLLEKISEGVDFELPETLVNSESEYALQNLKQNLVRAGSNLDRAGFDEAKLKKQFRPGSEKRVKEILILNEVAKQKDLKVDDEDVSEGFKSVALSMGQDAAALSSYYEANNLMGSFKQKLLEEKALKFLIETANVSEVKADKIPQKAETPS
ncbi:trigger factor [Thermodesulfobacteriota bacterium]